MNSQAITFAEVEPQDEPELAEHEVHVWRFRIQKPELVPESLMATLDVGDRNHAEAFGDAASKRVFMTARGATRFILSLYTEVAPRMLRFGRGEHGKPFLKMDDAPQFNVAHTFEWGVVAVTRSVQIGVDLERIRPMPDLSRVARDHFSRQEYAHLFSLPEDVRTEAFHACWTRKEAYIKALGGGVAIPLKSFDVSLEPGAPAEILGIEGSSEATRDWTMLAFEPAPDHCGAVAIARGGMRARGFHFPPG
jgi:4'-phosphopantetheinyl transferase